MEVSHGVDAGVGVVDLGKGILGVGFGDCIFEVPVEAGFEGFTHMAVDDGAGDAKCASELRNIAVLEVDSILEVIDDGNVAFSISKELGIVWVVGEGKVFGGQKVVELGFARNWGRLDGGVPQVNG